MMLFKVELPQWGSGRAEVQVSVIKKFKGGIIWRIDSVEEISAKGKTKRHFKSDSDIDMIRCRDTDEREERKQRFFVELLGESLYKEVLRQAWMQAMPDVLREE